MAWTTQAEHNAKLFNDLPIGSRFSTYYGSIRTAYYLSEVYTKTAPDTVQASDGRRWNAERDTAILTGAYILVPEGAYSIVPHDCAERV